VCALAEEDDALLGIVASWSLPSRRLGDGTWNVAWPFTCGTGTQLLAVEDGTLLGLMASWRRPSLRLDDGAWRAPQPHRLGVTALALVVEDGLPVSLTTGRRRPSRQLDMVHGAPLGLTDGWRRRWCLRWRMAHHSESRLDDGVSPTGLG
jgi:hypothetical protein